MPLRPALVALLAVFVATVATAQAPAPPPPPRPVAPGAMPGRPAPFEVTPVTRPADEGPFELAQRLLRSGEADEAAARLEDLLAAEPGHTAALLLLRDAYVAARRWDDALALVARREAASGPTAALGAERGALLHRAGRPDEARRAWDETLARDPQREATYRAVADAMAELRLHADAETVLARGAEALRDPARFEMARAGLLSADGRHEEAAARYLDALAADASRLNDVRTALARTATAPGATEAFARAADATLARHPTNRVVRHLVGAIALERGDYPRALDAARALDRLEREEGRGLLVFAEAAEGAGALDEAASALGEVVTRYPDSREATEARARRAALAVRRADTAGERAARGPTPHADLARSELEALATSVGPDALTPRALLVWAALLRDVYDDPDGARALLVRAAARPESADEAALALANTDLRAGDLDAARERYADLEARVRLGPLAEQARYELARLDFYEGLVYSALARVEAMDDNTAADVSNDAIALRVLLQENITEVGADTVSAALQAFAAASLLHRRGRDAQALTALDSLLAAMPGHPITDDVLFLRAHVLLELGRPAEAVETLDRLAEADAASFYRDRALVVQGETLERLLADPGGASARYEQLLTLFPASLFAPEARLHLRRLRAPS